MEKTCIVTDSSSGISCKEAAKLGVRVLPMPFYIDDRTCFEGVDLDRDSFLRLQKEGRNITTSQPSPYSLTEFWDEILKEYEELLYIPISSGLSGSYGTAAALASDEAYEGRVFVSDAGRVSTPLKHLLMETVRLKNEGLSAKELLKITEDARENLSIYITVDTLEYLKKGGRITPAAAALGGLLQIKPVLKLGNGKLDSFARCRGMKKAKKEMISALRKELSERFPDASPENMVLIAASSASEEETNEWLSEIKEAFPGFTIVSDFLALAITAHTGPGALAIGCSVNL